MARPDPHSVFDDAQPRVRRLDWRVRASTSRRARHRGRGAADVARAAAAATSLDLDARDLTIEHVGDDERRRGSTFELEAPRGFSGSGCASRGRAASSCIRYRTSPAAMALHWSNQSVYSACQPIYARTIVPLPDSPSSRIAYRAELTAPRALTALMAATPVERVVRVEAATRRRRRSRWTSRSRPTCWRFAVGDYAARELSPRSRVWAAPALVDAAARALAASTSSGCSARRSGSSAPIAGAASIC